LAGIVELSALIWLVVRPASVLAVRLTPFESFAAYCGQRLGDDPHLWATTLFDELLELGYEQSYPTLTRQIPWSRWRRRHQARARECHYRRWEQQHQ